MQRAVSYVICAQAVAVPLLRQFSAVIVEDASTISLPEALKSMWHGCGGGPTSPGKPSKAQAALKIALRWDLLSGQLQGPCLQEGRSQELRSVLHAEVLRAGSLWIADLGYWTLTWLREVHNCGASFLMRYKAGIILWQGNQQLDLLDILPKQVGERLD